MSEQILLWGVFGVLVVAALALDLGVFHKKAHQPTFKESLAWTMVWVALSLCFAAILYFVHEAEAPGSGDNISLTFLNGYIIEKSLSLDNIFVMALVFRYFQIPGKYQHTVLYWGIVGAVVFRGLVILAGATLFAHISWIHYIFGAVLLYSAYKMFTEVEEEENLENSKLVKWISKIMPLTTEAAPNRFLVKQNGIWHMTPLLLSLLVVEVTDVVFAIDSVPAIFSFTQDFFLVFSSNIFAILGLRSMYFVLAAGLDKFRYLKVSLVVILAYVGTKLMLHSYFEIPAWASLTLILTSLSAGIGVSLYLNQREEKAHELKRNAG